MIKRRQSVYITDSGEYKYVIDPEFGLTTPNAIDSIEAKGCIPLEELDRFVHWILTQVSVPNVRVRKPYW